jgi:hypothetical protein
MDFLTSHIQILDWFTSMVALKKIDELVQQEVFVRKNSPLISKTEIEQSLAVPSKTCSTRSTHFWVSQGSNVRLHVENSELSSRAWCLQERLSSRRTMHFADDRAIYLESTADMQSIKGVRETIHQNRFRGPGIQAILRREALTDREHMESSLSRQAISVTANVCVYISLRSKGGTISGYI